MTYAVTGDGEAAAGPLLSDWAVVTIYVVKVELTMDGVAAADFQTKGAFVSTSANNSNGSVRKNYEVFDPFANQDVMG